MVGGSTPRSTVSTVNTDSIAPAAPSVCPVIDLVELTAIFAACSPNTCLIAWVSATSPCGFEVAVVEAKLHAFRGAVPLGRRRSDVVGVRVGSVTDDLRENFSAACDRLVTHLENERRR